MDTGKMICDAAVVDLVRSLATKSSWAAIASAVNDMIDAAWAREVILMDLIKQYHYVELTCFR